VMFQIATSTHYRPHWNFQHNGESITQHAENSAQHYNRLLLSAWRWTNAAISHHDSVTV